jgi:hypothetical protein
VSLPSRAQPAIRNARLVLPTPPSADQHQPVEAIELAQALGCELRLEVVAHLHRQAQVMAALLHRGDGREALLNPALVLRHPGIQHPGPVLQRAEQPRTQRQHLLPADRDQQGYQQAARGGGQRLVAEKGTERELAPLAGLEAAGGDGAGVLVCAQIAGKG